MRVTRRSLAAVGVLGAAFGIACFDAVAPRVPATDPQAIFDQVWQEFDRHYSLFEAKHVDWRSLGDAYRPLALGDEAGLRTALCGMLDKLEDLHVTLYTPSGRCGRDPRRTDSYDPLAITSQLYLGASMRTTPSLLLTYGVMGPDIGYLHISGFSDDRLTSEVDSAIASLSYAGAMIIDVRLNGGGSSAMAEDIAGRFVEGSTVYMFTRFRNGPSHSDFTGPIARRVKRAGPVHFSGPVALLINRSVGSAAEDFVMAMLTRPNVVLVGDTTSGTATNPLWRDLPNGWAFRLSQSIEFTPSGLAPSVVGGIPPAIFARTTRADSVAGFDVQLDSARAALIRSEGLPPR